MILDQQIADRSYMAEALRLAEKGLYSADPNPRVGCVLVRDDRVIGSGWHQIAGQDHAEIAAIRNAAAGTLGATAYVSLEPCDHRGRTGPCSEALVAAGIKRAVVAMVDPNPLVSGRGIRRLRDAGIEVVSPLLAEQAAAINPGFIKRHQQGLPFVRCKLAMSLDGRTALVNGVSRWITGSAAREDVQRLRARSSAIVTGIGTVLMDDPAMTVRAEELKVPDLGLAPIRQPLRVVLDSRLRISPDSRILQPPGQALVVCSDDNPAKIDELNRRGVRVLLQEGNSSSRIDLLQMLQGLADLECNEVLVEAGPTLAGSLVRSGLVDELIIYVAGKLLGSAGRPLLVLPEFLAMDEAIAVEIKEVRHLGSDLRLTVTVASAMRH